MLRWVASDLAFTPAVFQSPQLKHTGSLCVHVCVHVLCACVCVCARVLVGGLYILGTLEMLLREMGAAFKKLIFSPTY